MREYTVEELRDIAQRGRLDPVSLTSDEIRALCLFLKRVGTLAN